VAVVVRFEVVVAAAMMCGRGVFSVCLGGHRFGVETLCG